MTSPSASWLRRLSPRDDAGLRIVCFPHAGAGASSFNGWFRHLPDEIELVRVQLPGREDNGERPAFTRMEDLIPELYCQVLPLLDRPLAIYGHSMGALVAFELARALRRNGCPAPVALLVSGRRAPHKPLRRVLLHVLSEADLVAHLRKMGGTSADLLVRPKWLERYLPTMRADLQLSDIYHYRDEPLLTCPIHAFLGEEDNEMHREDWEAWSEQAGGAFSRALLPGGHVFSQSTQAILVSLIVEALAAAVRAPPRASTAEGLRAAQDIARDVRLAT